MTDKEKLKLVQQWLRAIADMDGQAEAERVLRAAQEAVLPIRLPATRKAVGA